MHDSPTRRRVLQSASVVGGAFALAGCLGSASPSASQSPTPTNESTPEEAIASTETGDETPLEEWLALANRPNFRSYRPVRDDVNIAVGPGSVPFSFDPADVTVNPGTTITWSWMVLPIERNVVALDGSFDSGEPTAAVSMSFEYTFEETGTYRYVSEPQRDCGMRGVVRVRDLPESDYPAVDRWLAAVDHYDGTIVDETGRSAVSVTVAAENLNDGFSFDPPAMKVAPGTTVRWEWSGAGGAHDVVFDEADIEGSPLQPDEGATYEYTFDSPGVYRYTCRPHQFVGQKGAIVVE